jgi:Protein of unknown function (DUF2971)
MDDFEYVREEDREEYRRFAGHHHVIFASDRPPVNEIWHYTDAAGLIGIIQSGEIWCTQVSCLNDSLEQRYFGDLVHASVKTLRASNTNLTLGVLLRVADDSLANQDVAPVGNFVACFSEVEDDLGQWRGYGGGQCGYALGFRVDRVLEALKLRPSAAFLPMHYEHSRHQFLVADVLRMAQAYFIQGVQRGLPDVERWAREFLDAFAMELGPFASVIKHPKFSSERERRIVTFLQKGEHTQLEFRQRRTLLARHLPIDLTVNVGTAKLLPLTRVYIGPGPTQRVSQVSVGDLLLKYGYQDVPVELSKVPYRVP